MTAITEKLHRAFPAASRGRGAPAFACESEPVEARWIGIPTRGTVAFNPFANGEVGVVQIQLRQKKGNRFLYQLGAHYVDFALDILARAFGEDKLHIVDGKSAVAGVRASYGQSPCAIDEEAEARIAGIYDRPLERFTREEGLSRENLQKRSYFRLIPRTS